MNALRRVARAPSPLRVLVAWPGALAVALRHGLLTAGADVTCVNPASLASQVIPVDFYHVLVMTPGHWHDLATDQRRRMAERITLVVLAPDAASPEELSNTRAGLYLPNGATAPVGIGHLTGVVRQLIAGTPLDVCAGPETELAWVGSADCWPETPKVQPAPNIPRAHTATLESSAGTLAIHIGVLNNAGDVIYGSKTVHHATGDQINVGSTNAAKIVQDAGGDQINLQRVAATRTDDQPAAPSDDTVSALTPQTATPTPRAFCDHCGEAIGVGDAYCESCGSRQ